MSLLSPVNTPEMLLFIDIVLPISVILFSMFKVSKIELKNVYSSLKHIIKQLKIFHFKIITDKTGSCLMEFKGNSI